MGHHDLFHCPVLYSKSICPEDHSYQYYYMLPYRISQLYKAGWIDNLRHTFLGRMILGEIFMWGDLASYTAGILAGVLIEVFTIKRILNN
jgi:hypothetical protein